METNNVSWKYLIIWYAFLALMVLLFFVVLIYPSSARPITDFNGLKPTYQDWQGIWHIYINNNLIAYPYYTQNGTYASRMEDTLALNIPGAIYTFNLNRISVNLNYTPSQINSRSTADGVNWYIPIPESLYKTRFLWDNVKPSVSNDTGVRLNSSNFWYDKSSGQLRFYYNQTARTFGINSKYVFFNFTTYIITNATTVGFTSSNISTDGYWSAYGGGSIGTPLNASINANLSLYADCEATSGTIQYGINNHSRFPNNSIQGTWFGNTTLNYTAGQNWGNACLFDGLNDYNIISNPPFGTDTRGSFSTKIQINDLTKSTAIFWYGISGVTFGSNDEFGVSFLGNDVKEIQIFGNKNGVTSFSLLTSANAINDNNIHIVNITSDGSIISLYIDGVKQTLTVDVGSNSGKWFGSATTANAFVVGASARDIIYNALSGTQDETIISSNTLGNRNNTYAPNWSMNITNQTASAVNIISSVRFNISYLNILNNTANISARQNGTSTWTQIATNYISQAWVNQSYWNNTDFLIEIYGNGSSRAFVVGGDIGETPILVLNPSISNMTYNFGINQSWVVGGSTLPDKYNVSVNSVWDNTSVIPYRNNTYTPHSYQNITVCGYNNTVGVGACSNQNTQIPNNIPVPKTIHATYLVNTGVTLNFTINATDADSDTLVYSSNNTIGTFNISTGNFTYTGIDTDAGNYTIYFKVDDGYGGVVNQITTITEQSTITAILNEINKLPTKEDVANAGVVGFVGGIIGGCLAVGVIRRYNRKF